MTIAERIFDLMKKQGKKQSDIARLLNVRPATVSEWKKGKREPLGAHYEKLADYFGVSIDYLITGREARGAPVQQIIGNNNNHNTAIAGAASALSEFDRELLKVVAGFDIRRKTEILHFAYTLEKQIKDEEGL